MAKTVVATLTLTLLTLLALLTLTLLTLANPNQVDFKELSAMLKTSIGTDTP